MTSVMSTEKGYKGMPMEGIIASWYAKNTLKDIHRHKLMAARLAPQLAAGARVLEIAPGPGYFSIELAKLGDFHITGLDISRSFVEIARRNAERAGVDIEFRWGNAAEMPFDADSFDFMYCQAAFKNFSQPAKAIAEMHRTLRRGGTALISDLRRDASREDIRREVDQMQLGVVDGWLTMRVFETTLLKNAYSVEAMQKLVAASPFHTGRVEVEGISFEARLTK